MLAIFNFFVRESFAAYAETELTLGQFAKMLEQARIILTLRECETTVGYGYLSPYKPFANFARTAVLTYFIKPSCTGMGYGTGLLESLFEKGREIGIRNYLAHISSRNEQSLNFHKKHGFKEVGRFKDVAIKFGEIFDVVWVQKQLEDMQ